MTVYRSLAIRGSATIGDCLKKNGSPKTASKNKSEDKNKRKKKKKNIHQDGLLRRLLFEIASKKQQASAVWAKPT